MRDRRAMARTPGESTNARTSVSITTCTGLRNVEACTRRGPSSNMKGPHTSNTSNDDGVDGGRHEQQRRRRKRDEHSALAGLRLPGPHDHPDKTEDRQQQQCNARKQLTLGPAHHAAPSPRT